MNGHVTLKKVKLKIGSLIKKFTLLDWLLVILLIGFMSYFLISGIRVWFQRKESVEFMASESGSGIEAEVMADVSGAVVSPGVYKLSSEARIKDALVAAGGISATADREYIAAEVNQAARVADGMKIFIPSVSSADGEVRGATASRINVNTATLGQLDGLAGIGEARAAEIIANRPYARLDDLVEKRVLSKSVLDKIRDKIAVY